MQTVKAFIYDQKVEVQILDTTIFTTRNRIVYSRPIKVYQGIDNPLQIIVKNQDQKNFKVQKVVLKVLMMLLKISNMIMILSWLWKKTIMILHVN